MTTTHNIKFNYRHLSQEDEVALIKECVAGNVYAKENLIKYYDRLIKSIAYKQSNHVTPYLTLDDFFAEGTIELLKSVNKFEPERNVRFATWVVWRITNCMHRLRWKNSYVQVPNQSVWSKIGGLLRIQETNPESLTDKNKEILQAGLAAYHSPVYLDESTAVWANIDKETPERILIIKELNEDISNAVKSLSEVDIFIISRFFGLWGFAEMSVTDISAVLQITPKNVSTRKANALKKLREKLPIDLLQGVV